MAVTAIVHQLVKNGRAGACQKLAINSLYPSVTVGRAPPEHKPITDRRFGSNASWLRRSPAEKQPAIWRTGVERQPQVGVNVNARISGVGVALGVEVAVTVWVGVGVGVGVCAWLFLV